MISTVSFGIFFAPRGMTASLGFSAKTVVGNDNVKTAATSDDRVCRQRADIIRTSSRRWNLHGPPLGQGIVTEQQDAAFLVEYAKEHRYGLSGVGSTR